ncbi:distal tail protein Dit [Halobacillus ihumii]|uniref:distal tail protein Dit n=1 Tax=Halobacillus ihumii TaxID=2686092 RepID=UPI0013D2B562|nr:distal tail protein Dit [Halobacillus ihumii]
MNGFTFDGVHSDSLNVVVNKKNIPMTPPISNRFQEIKGFDGAWDYGMSYDPREIEVECTIFGDGTSSMKNNARRFASVLNPRKGTKMIIFDDEPDKCYFGRVSNQIPLEQVGQMGTFTIQFTCAQMPHTYGVDLRVGTYSTVFPVTHNGMYVAKPTLTITHNGGDGAVSLTRNDGNTLTLTFSSDSPASVYEIDCIEKTMVETGSAAYQYVSGDWFEMDEGENTYEASGNVAEVTFEFRDTWL